MVVPAGTVTAFAEVNAAQAATRESIIGTLEFMCGLIFFSFFRPTPLLCYKTFDLRCHSAPASFAWKPGAIYRPRLC